MDDSGDFLQGLRGQIERCAAEAAPVDSKKASRSSSAHDAHRRTDGGRLGRRHARARARPSGRPAREPRRLPPRWARARSCSPLCRRRSAPRRGSCAPAGSSRAPCPTLAITCSTSRRARRTTSGPSASSPSSHRAARPRAHWYSTRRKRVATPGPHTSGSSGEGGHRRRRRQRMGRRLGLGPTARQHMLRWDGRTWTDYVLPGGAGLIEDVLAVAPDDVWAVGSKTDPMITRGKYSWEPGHMGLAHWDGTSWTTMAAPAGARRGVLRSVSGTGPTDVWAVGRRDLPGGKLQALCTPLGRGVVVARPRHPRRRPVARHCRGPRPDGRMDGRREAARAVGRQRVAQGVPRLLRLRAALRRLTDVHRGWRPRTVGSSAGTGVPGAPSPCETWA